MNERGYVTLHASKRTLDKGTGAHDLDRLSFTFVDFVKFAKSRAKGVYELTLAEKFYCFLRGHAPDMKGEVLGEGIGEDTIIKRAFSELELSVGVTRG